MKTVLLGDIASFGSGGTPSRAKPAYWKGTTPWITGADIAEDQSVAARSFITDEAVKRSSTQVCPTGTVVLVTRTSVGKVGVLHEPIAINQDLTAITPVGDLNQGYLVHFLRSQAYVLASQARGATIKGVTRDAVESLLVPLPGLVEQRRIAAILDHADDLRAKRRHVLAHLNTLTQSIFDDMFASGAFESVSASTLMPNMRNGLSPATAGTHAAEVLTLSAVTQGDFDPSAVKPGIFAIDPPADKRVAAGDFLMCRGNGNKSFVGVGTYPREARPDLVFPDTVIAGTVDRAIVAMPFLEAAWRRRDVRTQIESVARTTNGTYKVNQQTLGSIRVSVPPLKLQNAFATRVERIDEHRVVVQRAAIADDALFSSLQARAFRGEL